MSACPFRKYYRKWISNSILTKLHINSPFSATIDLLTLSILFTLKQRTATTPLMTSDAKWILYLLANELSVPVCCISCTGYTRSIIFARHRVYVVNNILQCCAVSESGGCVSCYILWKCFHELYFCRFNNKIHNFSFDWHFFKILHSFGSNEHELLRYDCMLIERKERRSIIKYRMLFRTLQFGCVMCIQTYLHIPLTQCIRHIFHHPCMLFSMCQSKVFASQFSGSPTFFDWITTLWFQFRNKQL